MNARTTIQVRLNGKDRHIDEGHTVRSLLESLDLHPGMVVVELNRDILERDSYDERESQGSHHASPWAGFPPRSRWKTSENATRIMEAVSMTTETALMSGVTPRLTRPKT